MSEKEKKWRGIGESAEISAPDPRIGEYIAFRCQVIGLAMV